MAKDFAKSKCFIKTDNGYEEITYEELLRREEADPSYKGRRFLPLHGMLMEVTPEQYRDFYKARRRQKYLYERSRENRDISIDMLTAEQFSGADILVSDGRDIEEQVAYKLLLDKLHTPTLILFCAWPLHRRHKPPVFQKGRSKQMSTTYLRGQLYYADLSKGVGSEQEGYRPVLIVQNNVGNKYSPTVIVAAVTSKVGVKPKLPTHYFIEANTVGLTAPSIVLLEQLRTLDKRRLERYIGRVDSCHIREINRALAVSVGLMEEMPENLIMCLCPTCANNFYGTGSYYLRRVNTDSSEKDICTYCGQRRGFDYEIVRRGQ